MEQVDSKTSSISKSDMVLALPVSPTSHILAAPMSCVHHIMTSDKFVAWMRWFLMLPQVLRLDNSPVRHKAGYTHDLCMADHASGDKRVLDHSGNHHNSGCPSASQGMHTRHSNMKYCVRRFAQDAGVECEVEPPTHKLLLDQFTLEQCRVLFPKRPTIKEKKEIAALLKRMESTLSPEQKAALADDLSRRYEAALVDEKTKGKKGLRIDVRLRDGFTGKEWWCDTTCIHPTAASHIGEEISGPRASAAAPLTTRARTKAGASSGQTQLKHDVYGPLMAMATKQHLDGKRLVLHKFLAVVLGTTHGELGKETIHLVEALTACYRERLDREGERPDGNKPEDLCKSYRTRFRQGLLMAIAQGHAQMLTAAGLPSSSCKKHLRQKEISQE